MASRAKSHGLCGLLAHWLTRFLSSSLPILPEDIIYDILLLLPIKSLARFRCVCREWNNLLTGGSDFLKKHLDYAPHRLLIVSSLESLMSVDLEAQGNFVATNLDGPWKMRVHIITGSCNGLLCLLVRDHLFIWNPSTRKYKQLPPPPSSLFQNHPIFYLKEHIFYGFGYAMSIDGYYNYKLVRGVVRDESNDHINIGHGITRTSIVEIYTRKTNSWKRIQDFPYNNTFRAIRGTFVNGFLHWLAIRGKGKDFCNTIASLDLAKEEFGELLLPDFEQTSFSLDLGVLNGMLCVMCANTKAWDVYAMKEYGVPESWNILITLPSFLWTSVTMPLYMMKNGELVIQITKNKVVIYDPRKNTFKEFIDTKFGIASTTYVESLESP